MEVDEHNIWYVFTAIVERTFILYDMDLLKKRFSEKKIRIFKCCIIVTIDIYKDLLLKLD